MFGFHVSREWSKNRGRPTLTQHVEAARAFYTEESGGDERFAFQVFIAGPQNAKFTVDDQEMKELCGYINACNAENRPTWGVAHGTYIDSPWNYTKPSFKWLCKWIRKELKVAARCGLSGLVVHLNSHPVETVKLVAPLLLGGVYEDTEEECESNSTPPKGFMWGNAVLHQAPLLKEESCPPKQCVRIYLETPCLKLKDENSKNRTEGLVPYDSPEKLCSLMRQLKETVDPHLMYFGLCVDTAHIWSSGQKIASYEEAKDWLDRFEKEAEGVIPLGPGGGNVLMFHLNDEEHPRGSGADEHARLGMGRIWEGDADCLPRSGLQAFVDFARKWDVPMVLERKGKRGKDKTPLFSTQDALAFDIQKLKEVAP